MLALYKGEPIHFISHSSKPLNLVNILLGMASPLIGIAAVNSLLFTAYGVSKRVISPYPELSLAQTAAAGGLAGAINAVLASPVELFKIKMQGQVGPLVSSKRCGPSRLMVWLLIPQYGGSEDKRLKAVVADQYRKWGFRNGIMRGYWVSCWCRNVGVAEESRVVGADNNTAVR